MSDIKRPGLLDDPAPRPSQRPSLTADRAVPAPAGEAVSILSAVAADEPRSAPVKGPVRSGLAIALPWIGVAMLMLIAVAFWLEWDSTRRPAASPIVATSTPSAAVVKAAPAAVTAPPPAVVEAQASQAATIEVEPVKPQLPEPAAATPAPTLASAAAVPAAPVAKPAKVPPPAKPALIQRSPFAAIENPDAARKAKPRSPTGTGNRDVDLLAALLSGGTAVPPTASNVPRSKFSTKLSSMEPALAPEKREPTPSTRERLSLCNLMAPREVAACRAKVCKGLWGKDSACPADSAPPVRGRPD